MARDAEKAEAEAAYLGSRKTVKEIADEMGIPLSTMERWCRAGGWAKKRAQDERKAVQKARSQYRSKRERELQKLMEASGRLEDALMKAADQFARVLEEADEKKAGGKPLADGFRAKNLQSLASAIEGATRTRMMIAGIVAEADREKIALERRKVQMAERAEQTEKAGKQIEILMEPDTEGMAE